VRILDDEVCLRWDKRSREERLFIVDYAVFLEWSSCGWGSSLLFDFWLDWLMSTLRRQGEEEGVLRRMGKDNEKMDETQREKRIGRGEDMKRKRLSVERTVRRRNSNTGRTFKVKKPRKRQRMLGSQVSAYDLGKFSSIYLSYCLSWTITLINCLSFDM
jgi:hypothetical protein